MLHDAKKISWRNIDIELFDQLSGVLSPRSQRIIVAEGFAVFSTTIITNLGERRTECEISDDSSVVALVYEGHDGWHVNSLTPVRADERKDFDASIAEAKERLTHYVNRLGVGQSEDLTLGGLSLWLMQKDDGTAMGIGQGDNEAVSATVVEIPTEIQSRVRSLAQQGRQIDAIREIRISTNCSLAEAKAWLKDNC